MTTSWATEEMTPSTAGSATRKSGVAEATTPYGADMEQTRSGAKQITTPSTEKTALT